MTARENQLVSVRCCASVSERERETEVHARHKPIVCYEHNRALKALQRASKGLNSGGVDVCSYLI